MKQYFHNNDPYFFNSTHWKREWQSTPVFLPGEFHGQRSLEGYSLWGRKESDTTERLTHTERIPNEENVTLSPFSRAAQLLSSFECENLDPPVEAIRCVISKNPVSSIFI